MIKMGCRRHLLLLSALSLGAAAHGAGEEYCKPLMMGAEEYAQARYASAERWYNRALAEKPDNATALIERGRSLSAQKKYAAADADYSRALKHKLSHRLTVRALSFKASNGLEEKKWSQVVADCNQLLKLNPHDPTAFEKRGTAYEQMGRREQGKKDRAEALNIAPHSLAYKQVVNLLNAEGDVRPKFRQAILFLERHVAQHPYDSDAYFNLAGFYSQTGRTKDALNAYDKTVKYNPTRFASAYERAGFLASQKMYREAIQAYTESFELGPNNEHVLLDRAATYAKLKDYANSIKDYSVMVAKHPEEEDPLHFRARVYVLDKQYAKALADYNKVIELAPEQAANYSERSKILEALGKHDLALKDTKRAAELMAAPLN